MPLYPTPAQIAELRQGPADRPVVMLNLLRFKQRADAPDEGVSGREAYARYAAAMREIVESSGGRFVWAGRVDSVVIGESDFGFHAVGLVEYPSRQKFLELMADPRVAEIAPHRAAGLESQWLVASSEGGL